jgi:hypothetical protein
MEWLVPWHSIEEIPSQVAGMEAELRREVTAGHPLDQVPVRALGRRQDNDDVLFLVEDGTRRVAVVHLTWSPHEKAPWPWTNFYPSLEDWVTEGMRPDYEEFHSQ